MKKILAFVIMVMTLMCFSACGEDSKTVEIDGVEYTINKAEDTITDGENTFEYKIDGSGDSYTIEIYYPDGTTYTWTQNNEVGVGEWKNLSENGVIVSSDTLVEVAKEDAPKKVESKPWFLVVILGVFGLVGLIAPRGLWWLGYGWHYKNAEPSDAALVVGRIGGGIAILAAIIMAIVFVV
ncbi:MAG: hypothetical protein IJ031_03105 [Oscillospiraceae bacterium]|nr:hypothetical protein [Oscillospiraceae bacterium]